MVNPRVLVDNFRKPHQVIWVLVATAFVVGMLVMDSFVDSTATALVTQFAGVLALIVGTGFLTRGSRAMMSGRRNFALVIGSCGLLILGVGIIEVIVAGASDFAKELGGMVGGGVLGFFIDED